MSTHTPTPWDYDAHTDIFKTVDRRNIKEQMANAAFIVKAVNSHAELLDMLKTATNYLAEGSLLKDQCKQAIAKAEGAVK